MKLFCNQILSKKVFKYDYIDLVLGIGKIQIFKYFHKKRWEKISAEIHKIQEEQLINILIKKDRVKKSYQAVINSLKKEYDLKNAI